MTDLERELLQHAGAMRALAARLVGIGNADDLVQETTLLAWERPPARVAGLGGWLLGVLRHRASKSRRGAQRRGVRERAVARDMVVDTVDAVVQRETIQRLHGALMKLPQPYQAVVLQRFFQDKPPTAIAETTGVPLATVKSQLQRGLAMLRQALDDDIDGDGKRRDWRAAFLTVFELPLATRSAASGVTVFGAMLMSTPSKVGAVVAAVLGFAWWQAASPAPSPLQSPPETVSVPSQEAPATSVAQLDREAAVPPSTTPSATAARVRLVDRDDRQPLPQFAVRLVRNPDQRDEGEVLVSDEQGELQIPGGYRGQPFLLSALDDEQDPGFDVDDFAFAAESWPAADTVLEVPFATGPTYSLLFDQVPPEGELQATLIAGDDVHHAIGNPGTRVRRSAQSWVRLRPSAASAARSGYGPWSLVVTASTGDWLASGAVQVVRGVQREPVLLHGMGCGSIVVTPTIGQRPPTAAGIHASVYRLDANDAPTGRDRTRHIDSRQTSGYFDFLAAGRYRVYVRHHDALHEEVVDVPVGARVVVKCDFAPTTPRMLEVVARSQTGTRELFVLSFVAREVGGTRTMWSRYVRKEPGRQIHAFDGLDDQDWIIELQPTPHLPPWATMQQRVAGNATAVEFVCLDANAPPAGAVCVRVLDADSGKVIEGAGVTAICDAMVHLQTTTDATGVATLSPYVAGKPMQLLVRAVDRAAVLLDVMPNAQLDAPPVEVRLRSGWGTLLTVYRASDELRPQPLAGVRVVVDGAFAGVTDANGLLLLNAAAPPRRIDLQHTDWEIHYGAIDAATGAPEAQAQSAFFVVMRARQ